MSRKAQKDRITSVVARNKPLEGLHHVSSGRLKWGAAVLRGVGQHHHVGRCWIVATVTDKIFAHIHSIVDAAIQLMTCSIVIDANKESFAARHVGRCWSGAAEAEL
jgi:hypothetical protein